MSDSMCRVCGSYVHKYFASCPSCGALHDQEYLGADPASRGYDGAAPSTLDELRQRMASAEWSENQELVDGLIEVLRDQPLSPELLDGLASAAATGDDEYFARQIARHYQLRIEPAVSKYATAFEFRYLGGLPHPPTDVRCAIDNDSEVVIWRQGAATAIARFPSHRLLIATPFAEDVPILHNAHGFSFGNVFTISHPTSKGGGLTLTWSNGQGADFTLAIGNRVGLFAAGGKPEFYEDFAKALGFWAEKGAEAREREVGSRAYAAELGFPVASPDAEAPGVKDRLRQLDSLREDGLVTEAEYERKRSDILADL